MRQEGSTVHDLPRCITDNDEVFMKLKPVFWTSLAATLLAGCATGQSPYVGSRDVIVDTQGVDHYTYQRDLADCRAYADQVGVAGRTATGAVGGAVVGGLLGAAAGNSTTAQRAAGVGAVAGGAGGVASGYSERQRVVRNCMSGRGYRVLN